VSATARRDRQIVEITALVARGDAARAEGLALEHIAEFPADAPRLDQVTGSRTRKKPPAVPVAPPSSISRSAS
jgi:hypothetical protein